MGGLTPCKYCGYYHGEQTMCHEMIEAFKGEDEEPGLDLGILTPVLQVQYCTNHATTRDHLCRLPAVSRSCGLSTL